MLSIFPTLLVFSLAAPLILRLTAGVLFLIWGIKSFGSEKSSMHARIESRGGPAWVATIFGLAELVIGGFLIVGLYTQIAALLGVVLAINLAFLSRKEQFGSTSMLVYILVAIISFSLALTGPGFFAFDLPL